MLAASYHAPQLKDISVQQSRLEPQPPREKESLADSLEEPSYWYTYVLEQPSGSYWSALGKPVGISGTVERIVADRSEDLSPSLNRRIKELSSLRENWDGENAKQVKAHVLADVVELLKLLAQRQDFQEPFLAPTFDGFVQIEWHGARRSLEIEANNRGWSISGTWNTAGGPQYFDTERERTDFKALQKFYDWFLDRELIWPSE